MLKKRTKDYRERYLKDCALRKRLSDKTIRAYQIDLNQFFIFLKNAADDENAVKSYIHDLNERYEKCKTIKRKLASIKAYYAYLEYEELIDHSPFRKIRTQMKEPKILPKIISKNDLQAIFDYLLQCVAIADTQYKMLMAVRNLALSQLLLATGIRISELCNIRKSDLNLNEKCLRIWGKGAKERIIYIGNDGVVNMLKKYADMTEDMQCEYFFLSKYHTRLSEQSVRILLQNLESELQLTHHITPHMFRHTFATSLLEKDVDTRYIQQILGHSSIATTQIYTYVSAKKQKEVLMKRNPLNDFDCFVAPHLQ